FISAQFLVNMEVAEQEPPVRAVMKAHGQAPGSIVDATAEMQLSDDGDGATRMDWEADVTISGAIAGVGARLIEGTANKMIAQSFDCIRTRLEACRGFFDGAPRRRGREPRGGSPGGPSRRRPSA